MLILYLLGTGIIQYQVPMWNTDSSWQRKHNRLRRRVVPQDLEGCRPQWHHFLGTGSPHWLYDFWFRRHDCQKPLFPVTKRGLMHRDLSELWVSRQRHCCSCPRRLCQSVVSAARTGIRALSCRRVYPGQNTSTTSVESWGWKPGGTSVRCWY